MYTFTQFHITQILQQIFKMLAIICSHFHSKYIEIKPVLSIIIQNLPIDIKLVSCQDYDVLTATTIAIVTE